MTSISNENQVASNNDLFRASSMVNGKMGIHSYGFTHPGIKN